MQYSLKVAQEDGGQKYLLLDNAGRIYSISQLLFDILSSYQMTKDYKQTLGEINKKHSIDKFTTEFIERSVVLAFDKLKSNSTGSRIDDGLYGKISMLKSEKFQNVYRFFSILFYNRIFYPAVILSVLSATFFFYNLPLQYIKHYPSVISSSFYFNIATLYLLFPLIILFHEIGHASASKFFNVKPREIGFAFYFIFPVFYSNVTNIWQLPVKQRNIVNLGGIYFQLIINIILVFLFNILQFKAVLFPLVISNLLSITGSLNPFFRYDGYWVVSDTFNLPNLGIRSQKFLFQLISDYSVKAIRKNTVPLITYSVLKVVFWAVFYIAISRYILTSSSQLFKSVQALYSGKGEFKAGMIFTGVSLLLTIYLIIIQLIKIFNPVGYETRRIFKAKRYTA